MADDNLTDMPTKEEATPESAEVSEKQGFLPTAGGKTVLIGGAVALLLVVAAAVAFLVYTFVFVDDAVEITEGIVGETQETATDPATSEGEAGNPATDELSTSVEHVAIDVSKIHVWRDIFQPLLTPVEPEVVVTDDGTPVDTTPDTTPDGGTTYEQDTLYLLDIMTGSGETVAQFYFNGIDYNTSSQFTTEEEIVVLEGDRLAETPWRLLSIGITSVTLQYGDSTVGLSIGQGIQK